MRALARTVGRSTVALALGGLAALGLATGALAYWSGAGAGSATGTASDPQPLTLSAGTAGAQLYPGASADVSLTISNSNSFAVHVSTLALDTTQGTAGFAVDAGHSGCAPASTLAFTAQSNGTGGWTVPANGSLPLELPGALSMSSAAASDCQGASFSIYLRVGP